MEDVVNEVLGDADPNDRVRFAILSTNFDRALNTMYQPRNEVTGVALAELLGKMLQSNQSIDNDFFLEEDLLKSTNNIYRIVEKKDIRNTVIKIEERNRENPRQPKIYIYAKLSVIDLIEQFSLYSD